MKFHTPKTLSLKDYFKNETAGEGDLPGHAQFLIPNLQRAYEWKKSHVERLVDDLYDSFSTPIEANSDNAYYMHQILFIKDESKTPPIYQILDGQQRTISLLIVLRAIYEVVYEGMGDNSVQQYIAPRQFRNNAEKNAMQKMLLAINTALVERDELEGSNGFRLDSHHERDKYFIESLLSPESSVDFGVKEDLEPEEIDRLSYEERKKYDIQKSSSRRMIPRRYNELIAELREQLELPETDEKKIFTPSRLLKFLRFIWDRVYFSSSTFNNEVIAFAAFATANDRGLSLSTYDLIRYYSFHHVAYLKRTVENFENAKAVDLLEKFWDDRTDGVAEQLGSDKELFLASYWQGREGKRINNNEIAREINDFFKENIKDYNELNEFILKLKSELTNFIELKSPSDVWGTQTKWKDDEFAGPVLFFANKRIKMPLTLLMSAKLIGNRDKFLRVFNAIDTLYVRSILTGIQKSNAHDNKILESSLAIRKALEAESDRDIAVDHAIADFEDYVYGENKSQYGYGDEDNAFGTRLCSHPFVGAGNIMYILKRLELEKIRKNSSGDSGTAFYHTSVAGIDWVAYQREHIMPSKLPDTGWSHMDSGHKANENLLGNFITITGPKTGANKPKNLNSKISNKPFSKKITIIENEVNGNPEHTTMLYQYWREWCNKEIKIKNDKGKVTETLPGYSSVQDKSDRNKFWNSKRIKEWGKHLAKLIKAQWSENKKEVQSLENEQ